MRSAPASIAAAAALLVGCKAHRIGDDYLGEIGQNAESVFYQDERLGKTLVVVGQNQSESFRVAGRALNIHTLAEAATDVFSRWSESVDLDTATAGAGERLSASTGAETEQLRIRSSAAAASATGQ